MLEPNDINHHQVPLIREIESNETWLLGERVGHPVDPKSSEVQSLVIEIVLQWREQWRKELESRLGGSSGSSEAS